MENNTATRQVAPLYCASFVPQVRKDWRRKTCISKLFDPHFVTLINPPSSERKAVEILQRKTVLNKKIDTMRPLRTQRDIGEQNEEVLMEAVVELAVEEGDAGRKTENMLSGERDFERERDDNYHQPLPDEEMANIDEDGDLPTDGNEKERRRYSKRWLSFLLVIILMVLGMLTISFVFFSQAAQTTTT